MDFYHIIFYYILYIIYIIYYIIFSTSVGLKIFKIKTWGEYNYLTLGHA